MQQRQQHMPPAGLTYAQQQAIAAGMRRMAEGASHAVGLLREAHSEHSNKMRIYDATDCEILEQFNKKYNEAYRNLEELIQVIKDIRIETDPDFGMRQRRRDGY